jgi:hypothetical protein
VADPIVDRIVRESGVPDLVEVLAERLAPTDLQSLLLAVYRRRAARLAPSDVLAHYERSRLFRPTSLDAELDRLASSLLPAEYEVLELSPIAPLGTVSALTGLSQDAALATARGTEVVSDATNVLALETALRRRQNRTGTVRLAASQRVLRTQAPDEPGVHPHFRLLALVAGGRERETTLLLEQLDFYVRLLAAAGAGKISVRLTVLDGAPELVGVLEELRERDADVDVGVDPAREHGRGYYTTACFDVRADDTSMVDGGFVDWTQRLLSDRKERLLISGAGVERLASLS